MYARWRLTEILQCLLRSGNELWAQILIHPPIHAFKIETETLPDKQIHRKTDRLTDALKTQSTTAHRRERSSKHAANRNIPIVLDLVGKTLF